MKHQSQKPFVLFPPPARPRHQPRRVGSTSVLYCFVSFWVDCTDFSNRPTFVLHMLEWPIYRPSLTTALDELVSKTLALPTFITPAPVLTAVMYRLLDSSSFSGTHPAELLPSDTITCVRFSTCSFSDKTLRRHGWTMDNDLYRQANYSSVRWSFKRHLDRECNYSESDVSITATNVMVISHNFSVL